MFPDPLTHSELASIQQYIEVDRIHVENVKKSILSIDSYCEIFGTHYDDTNAIVKQLDAIIASVGPAGTTRAFSQGDDYGGLPRTWLKNHTFGDVGGLLIHRPPDDGVPKPEIDFILQQFEIVNKHWLGVRLTDFKMCADRSATKLVKNRKPGVILLGVGKERAEIVLECIKRDIVSYLIIDNNLADALSVLLEREMKRPQLLTD